MAADIDAVSFISGLFERMTRSESRQIHDGDKGKSLRSTNPRRLIYIFVIATRDVVCHSAEMPASSRHSPSRACV